ncbi:MAG TPA: hypothetical protein VKR61_11975 [Bryobacteraceae bacterium]|nr:hypothetical protein [Bryobacteraceae bacterium]
MHLLQGTHGFREVFERGAAEQEIEERLFGVMERYKDRDLRLRIEFFEQIDG